MASKEEATSRYEEQIVERDIPGRPWTSLSLSTDRQVAYTTWKHHVAVDIRIVEVPKFSLHIVRRAIRILFFESDEGP